jgi:hypothetical protein
MKTYTYLTVSETNDHINTKLKSIRQRQSLIWDIEIVIDLFESKFQRPRPTLQEITFFFTKFSFR